MEAVVESMNIAQPSQQKWKAKRKSGVAGPSPTNEEKET
jgi:hypothetical protein